MECTKQAYGFMVITKGKKKHIRLAEIIRECEILGIHVMSPYHIVVISETLNQAKGTRNIVKHYGFNVTDVTDVFIPEQTV